LPLLWFLFPVGQVLLFPLFLVIFLLGLLGYRYLRKAGASGSEMSLGKPLEP
jgi:hypothetical protein